MISSVQRGSWKLKKKTIPFKDRSARRLKTEIRASRNRPVLAGWELFLHKKDSALYK